MTTNDHQASRFEAFQAMAEWRASGRSLFLPRYQVKNDRRLHLRQTLREDHQTRIWRRPQSARKKFDKLSGSLFSFFRGTALLFYRDMAGEDAWSPTVLSLGDVHPENFGVMPSEDDAPFFGVNDFDEAYFAPFTWDIKRGAVGFLIAAYEYGISKKKRRKILRKFVEGYVDGLRSYDQSDSEMTDQLRLDNSPPIISDLIEESITPRSDFLKKYLGEKNKGFVSSKKLVSCSSRVEQFQAVIDEYRERHEVKDRGRAGSWVVKDVAEKRGSGTASLGLQRYFVLIEGPDKDGSDDIILELKQARRSALAGLAPPSQSNRDRGAADRVVTAHAVHLVGGDSFYGKANLDGVEYLVRERSPFKAELDLSELSPRKWRDYAQHCGRVLAQAHARSDAHLEEPHEEEAEKRILMSIADAGLFLHDIECFALEAFQRVKRDHAIFQAEHERGAFDFTDSAWV